MADPGGGFDVPSAKCPPDRGSSDCVTGSLASRFSVPVPQKPHYFDHFIPQNSPLDFDPFSKLHNTHSIGSPSSSLSDSDSESIESFTTSGPSSGASPKDIPRRSRSLHGLDTPPLTPDDEPFKTVSGDAAKQAEAALEFLTSLFPHAGLSALPFARRVSISSPTLGATFDGIVLELPGRAKTLYLDGKNLENGRLRESIVALLDLADERLQCEGLVISFEKQSPVLGDILHSLMYVGGTVVTKPPFQLNPALVLVGLEV